jgi:hypothetical protein
VGAQAEPGNQVLPETLNPCLTEHGWLNIRKMRVTIVSPYRDDRYPMVEVFRKGDLVDFSLGFFRSGLPRSLVKQVKEAIPNAGFHKFLMQGAREWFAKHPLSPPPFMKW